LDTLGRGPRRAPQRSVEVERPEPDPVIEAYKPGIDQTLLIENLRLSVDDRLRINIEMCRFGEEADRAPLQRLAESGKQ
jgi:hypothetical protein